MGDKSKPSHMSRKPGKSVKEKRAERHAKSEFKATHLDIHELAKHR